MDADPAALADLDAVAATLATPLTLTSPATWDQWLPAGKPFPGTNTLDDLSTCPRLADRIGGRRHHDEPLDRHAAAGTPDGITYTVLTRDTRPPGVWVLSGSAHPDAAHPALDVLRPVVDGVVHAYG